MEAVMPSVTVTIGDTSRKMPLLKFYAYDLEFGATAELKILITDAERLAFFQQFVGRILDIQNMTPFDVLVTLPNKTIPFSECRIESMVFDFKNRTVRIGIESKNFIHEVYV